MKRRHEEDETANVHKLQEEKVHHAPHGKKKIIIQLNDCLIVFFSSL